MSHHGNERVNNIIVIIKGLEEDYVPLRFMQGSVDDHDGDHL